MPPAETGHATSRLVPASEIRRRIRGLQHALEKAQLEAALIVQRVDLFYFSGTAQNGFLFVPAAGDPLLMIRRFLPRARTESSLEHVVEISSVRQIAPTLAAVYGRRPTCLGLEFDVLPTREFDYYRSLLDNPECRDVSPLIHRLRMIKSAWELDRLGRTAALVDRLFALVQENLNPAAQDAEMGSLAEALARELGHAGKVRLRDPRQERPCWQIHRARAGDHPGPVAFGFVFVHQGYHVAETRMFALPRASTRILDACQALEEIQLALLERARPGLAFGELMTAFREKAQALGLQDAIQRAAGPGHGGLRAHGIGLELVEPPAIARDADLILVPGMVLALHLGFILQGGQPIESGHLLVITESGARRLSAEDAGA